MCKANVHSSILQVEYEDSCTCNNMCVISNIHSSNSGLKNGTAVRGHREGAACETSIPHH